MILILRFTVPMKGISVVRSSALLIFSCLIPLIWNSQSLLHQGTRSDCCQFPDQLFSSDVLNVLEKALDDPVQLLLSVSLMTLGYLKQAGQVEQVVPLLVAVCSSQNIAHVQGAMACRG